MPAARKVKPLKSRSVEFDYLDYIVHISYVRKNTSNLVQVQIYYKASSGKKTMMISSSSRTHGEFVFLTIQNIIKELAAKEKRHKANGNNGKIRYLCI